LVTCARQFGQLADVLTAVSAASPGLRRIRV